MTWLTPHAACALALVFWAHLVPTVGSSPKKASISLSARWPGTSSLLEAAEFLGEGNASAFWQYVEEWATHQAGSTDHSTGCWEKVLGTASSLLPSSELAQLLQVSLAVRQYSAKLEMYRQLSRASMPANTTSCCLAVVDTQHATDRHRLQQLLAAPGGGAGPQEPVFDWDHKLGHSGTSGRTAVLYAAPGTACFQAMHSQLSAAAKQGQLAYALRPVLDLDSCWRQEQVLEPCLGLGSDAPPILSGFGANMVVKNMEYSQVDDAQKSAGSKAAAGDSEEAPEEESYGQVKGFDFDRLLHRRPELKQELLTFRDHLASAQDDSTLKVWQLKDLGLQASQRIAAAANPLRLLTDLSQNFPSLMSSLSRTAVNSSFRSEVAANHKNAVQPGSSYMLINGLSMAVSDLDLYHLLDRVRVETDAFLTLNNTALPADLAPAMLALRAHDTSQQLDEFRVDLRPTKRTGAGVSWLNNLERDAQYRSWGNDLGMLLQPSMMYGLPRVARNLFNAIVIGDPLNPTVLSIAAGMAEIWESEQLPVRFGALFVVRDAIQRVREAQLQGRDVRHPSWEGMGLSERFVRVFLTMRDAYGPAAGWKLWAHLSRMLEPSGPGVTNTQLEAAFLQLWAAFSSVPARTPQLASLSPQAALQMVQRSEPHLRLDARVEAASRFCLLKGTAALQEALVWFNGRMVEWQTLGTASAAHKMLYLLQMEMQGIQEMLFYGRIPEDGDVLQEILESNRAVERYNPVVFGQADAGLPPAVVPLSPVVVGPGFARLRHLRYLHAPGTRDEIKPVTLWVVANPALQQGRELLHEAMRLISGSELQDARRYRLAVLLQAESSPSLLHRALLAAFSLPVASASSVQLADFVQLIVHAAADKAAVAAAAAAAGLDAAQLKAALEDGGGTVEQAKARLEQDAEVLQALGIPPAASAVVTNGRVVVVHDPAAGVQHVTMAEDLQLMIRFALDQQASLQARRLLQNAQEQKKTLPAPAPAAASTPGESADWDWLSDSAMAACSLVSAPVPQGLAGSAREALALQKAVKRWRTRFSAASWNARAPADPPPPLHIQVIVNPLAPEAQKLSQLLLFLSEMVQPNITLLLNPAVDLSKSPLEAYYRYSLPTFLSPRTEPEPATAAFPALPPNQVLTLNLDLPEAWLVEPTEAELDLDNIKLSSLEDTSTLHAKFELEALLLTGSCVDVAARRREQKTPRGVQLHLGNATHPHLLDTLVMSNLGYFQLKSAPGLWRLSLAPGRSRRLYQVIGSTGLQLAGAQSSDIGAADPFATELQTSVVISSLAGQQIILRIRKRAGMEEEDVLVEANEEAQGQQAAGGLAGSLSSWLFGKEKAEPEGAAGAMDTSRDKFGHTHVDDPVNIFTIASGHMYERLQKIMFLSVIKNTRSRVKFWLIKNYMSPQMKSFLPYMAEKYGFDYELVTYKWPSWLHKQTEKQRLIWAFKILFLDVLFPLEVRRIIFCDADQIIRSDIRELYDMDIGGAPYAYTPFCDNNKEMEGFRFWKQGFWEGHLKGKPYHISALYLVDLERFRQMAAGDVLRINYAQLSQDPNSLANLDQDLPNFVQHQVPIFSLPQEWLWCESWCGNETKAAARTIDLCNNPLTKEPKLQAARRIVAEWPGYDEEVAACTAEAERLLQQCTGTAAEGATEPAQSLGRPDAPRPDTDAAPPAPASSSLPDHSEL